MIFSLLSIELQNQIVFVDNMKIGKLKILNVFLTSPYILELDIIN